MEYWLKISLLLCTFGFLRELRPSEPYVTEYLAGDYGNLTSEQVYQNVYPFGTYSVLAQLVIVFLITDLVRYRPVIVLSAVAGIVLFALQIWCDTLRMLQVAQLFYGFFTAAEVAYYTYIYAKVDKERYQIVTGHTRAAILSGKFLGGLVAQILVSTDSMDYGELYYISLTTQIISLGVSLVLPSVPRSLYFYANDASPSPTPGGEEKVPQFSLKRACRLLWYHLVSSYSNRIVLQWSVWWALATCGQIQVISYIQFLWKEVAPEHQSVYNGGVEALATLLGAVGAIVAGMLNSNKRRSSYMLCNSICAAVLGGLLLYASQTTVLWVAYVNYVLFCAIFFFIITVAGAIVAENLVEDSFGLVFGINTLVGLMLQTILTIVVVEPDPGFGLGLRDQYLVNGGYFLCLGGIFGLWILIAKLCAKSRNSKQMRITT
ncbi:GL19735 [Drosophila persimilis]|uniref:GL19735 n=1 Tax=Drosophila persimilis TaxID=7234 RepID=B4HB29_DROPE|nr:thiamine transporter 1 [Drosophila persimilis]XP_026843114.1 thiamine transporter 1 [Drosophila persimilis]EDW37832.1 GL19735 [Drosophila persimilis]